MLLLFSCRAHHYAVVVLDMRRKYVCYLPVPNDGNQYSVARMTE